MLWILAGLDSSAFSCSWSTLQLEKEDSFGQRKKTQEGEMKPNGYDIGMGMASDVDEFL